MLLGEAETVGGAPSKYWAESLSVSWNLKITSSGLTLVKLNFSHYEMVGGPGSFQIQLAASSGHALLSMLQQNCVLQVAPVNVTLGNSTREKTQIILSIVNQRRT